MTIERGPDTNHIITAACKVLKQLQIWLNEKPHKDVCSTFNECKHPKQLKEFEKQTAVLQRPRSVQHLAGRNCLIDYKVW